MDRWALKTILSTRITDLINGIKGYDRGNRWILDLFNIIQ